MNKYLLLIIFIFSSLFSFAQPRYSLPTPAESKQQAKLFLKHLLDKQASRSTSALKTTALQERLIAQSDYSDTMGIVDSLAVTYGRERGSKFNFESMKYFDEGSGPDYTPFSDIYADKSGNINAYNHNYAPNVLSDSTQIWTILPGSYPPTFGYYATEYHSYDVKGNLYDFAYIAYTGVTGWRELSTYDVESNISSILELTNSYSSGTIPLDSNYFAVLTYNSYGQLLTDSISNFDHSVPGWTAGPSAKFVYSYDGDNNLTGMEWWGWNMGAWELTGTYSMTYYPGTHNIQTYAFGSGNPFAPIFTDSFGYSTSGNFSVYSIEKDYSTTGISGYTIKTKHLNSLSLPDTVNTYVFSAANGGTSISRDMSVFTYDAYHQPLICTSYFDTSTSMPTVMYNKAHFYYQVFNYTGVAETVMNLPDIKVYPNPSSDVISVSQTGTKDSRDAIMQIVNSLGQRVSSETIHWQNETAQISIAKLVPGTYWLTIQSQDGGVMHHQQIVKL